METDTDLMDLDLAEMSLSDLLSTDNPVLTAMMKKVVEEDDESSGIVAGFQSAI